MMRLMRRKGGFSFIELLVTMAFIGIIARLAVPRYHDMKHRATAAAILADVHTIRVAAFTYYTEKTAWPQESGPGIVPTELVSYLPENFSFTRPDFQYDYEVWPLSGGTPLNPQQETIIGVAVTANDPRLTQQMLKIAGKGYIPAVAGNKITFFVSGLSGS